MNLMTSMRRSTGPTLLACLLAAFSLSTASGQVMMQPASPSLPAPFTRIADTNTAVPGGAGTFSLFADAKAIEGGKVAFIGYDSGSGSGIYTFRNGVLDVLADESTPVPGTVSTFFSFYDVSIDNGIVAFTAAWPGTEGVLTSLFDGGPLALVDDSGSTPYTYFHGLEFHQGTIGVGGGINYVDVFHNHSESLLATSGGPLSALIDPTTAKPGGGTFVGLDQEFVFDAGGGFTFAEILPNTIGAVAGVYAYRNDGGGLRVIADATTPLPSGTGNFQNVAGFDADGERVAIVGRDSSNRALLYEGTSSADLQRLVSTATNVPGTGSNFLGLSNPMAYENGVIAFSGYWGGGGQGLFLHRNGAVEAVLKKGDVLDGAVVEQAFCRTRSISGRRMLIEVRFQSSPPLSHRALYLVRI